jgi:hypothetical protein
MVEYVLIIVAVLVLIAGAAFLFRDSVGRSLNRFTGVLAGEAASEDSAADDADGSGDSSGEGQQSDTSQQADGGGQAASEASSTSGSAADGQGGSIKTARSAEDTSVGLPEEDLDPGWTGGVSIWVVGGVAAFMVLIVLYFLNASKS